MDSRVGRPYGDVSGVTYAMSTFTVRLPALRGLANRRRGSVGVGPPPTAAFCNCFRQLLISGRGGGIAAADPRRRNLVIMDAKASIYIFVSRGRVRFLGNSSSPMRRRGKPMALSDMGVLASIQWRYGNMHGASSFGWGCKSLFVSLFVCNRNASQIPIYFLLLPTAQGVWV